ncbi:MAG: DUF4142 domain-containing protein [Terriglobia bacterium]
MRRTSDRAFAREAAEGGMAEVKLGKLAENKASNQAVKDFAQKMVQDHSAANDQLKSAASQANITLPSRPSETERATYTRLSKLSGTAFDRAYARDMVRDHEHDLAAFRREARNGRNDAIKSFASQTVPTLDQHLKLARRMDREVMGAGNHHHAAGMSSGTGTTQ